MVRSWFRIDWVFVALFTQEGEIMLSVSITQHLRMSRRVGLFTCCQRWFSTEKLTNLSSNSAMSKTVNKVSSNRQPTSVSCSTVAGITPLHSSKLNEPTEGGTTVTPSSSRPHLISALDVRESGCVDVTWSDSREATSYPRVWLRDNCRCPACYNMSSQSRTLLMRDLVLDVHPTDLQVGISPHLYACMYYLKLTFWFFLCVLYNWIITVLISSHWYLKSCQKALVEH